MLSVGVGRADITPPVGIAHAGWGAQTHQRAAGIDHPMVVTALYISDGETACVIIDLDLGKVDLAEATCLRNLIGDAVDVPPSHIRISYTHTHAGPLTGGDQRIGAGQELVAGYMAGVRVQVVGAARSAKLTARPSRMAGGLGDCNVAVNRRLKLPDGRVVVGENPGGYSDSSVLVVRFDDEAGQPIAAILGYAAHPITLAFQNDFLSPDYPGFARTRHEQLTGATTLFLQGCAGDQMAERGLTGDRTVSRTLGDRLAAAGAEVFLRLQTTGTGREFSHVVESGAPLGLFDDGRKRPIDSPISLSVISEQLSLPVRRQPGVASAEAEATRCLDRVHHLQGIHAPKTDIAAAMFEAKRAEMRLNWSRWLEGRDSAHVELQSIRIGDVALVGFPGEPFARIGSDVRLNSPVPLTHMGGYANGWHGYVPVEGAFEHGGYEVEWGSAFDSAAADVLTKAALDQLGRLVTV